ncbi:MAG: glycerol acyltransferase [Bacteroidetes bacterium]|nr:MAG: glycerol acyltransferase [Bacteroidota bacterium]
MMRLLSKLLYWLAGWKINGEVPPDLKKFVTIVGQHTSNWDFIYGMAGAYILKVVPGAKFLAKKEAFWFPLGLILKAMGGIPVDRFSSNSVVDQVVELFNKEDDFIIALSPEGTRSKVKELRKGFYYIALGAKVPIALAYLDFSKKEAGIGKIFHPTGDYEKDIEEIKLFYRDVKGKYPEKGIF